MEWVKLATCYDQDPRIVAVGEAAEILFVRGLALAGRTESRGFIPSDAVQRLTPRRSRQRTDALLSVGLWERVPGGFLICHWGNWQEEHDLLAERRKADRDRKRAKRAEQRASGVRGQSADSPGQVRALDRDRDGDSAAAAADTPPPLPVDDLPGELAVLRAKLEARRLVVRWDRLKPEQAQTIAHLVTVHGDGPLVAAAVASFRPESPPVFAQAWIGAWRALPEPGSRLRVVADVCDEHRQEQPCRGCAGDRKAAGAGRAG